MTLNMINRVKEKYTLQLQAIAFPTDFLLGQNLYKQTLFPPGIFSHSLPAPLSKFIWTETSSLVT